MHTYLIGTVIFTHKNPAVGSGIEVGKVRDAECKFRITRCVYAGRQKGGELRGLRGPLNV